MESIKKYWWVPVTGGVAALLAYYYWRFIKPCLPPPGNIIKNPSFEEGTSGWEAVFGYWTDDDHWCGKHCFMGKGGEDFALRQFLELKRRAIYRFQFRYRAESIYDRILVQIVHTYSGVMLSMMRVPGRWGWDVYNMGLYVKLIYDRPLSRGWREVLVEFETGREPDEEQRLDIYLPYDYQEYLYGNFYIDDVWLWFVKTL